MAGTSILATICAERLTKFLTRYTKSNTGSLRCNIPVDSVKPCIVPPTARVIPVERKYSLWQPPEYQFQMPIFERPKSLENMYGLNPGRSNPHLRMANSNPRPRVGTTTRLRLMRAYRTCPASYNGSSASGSNRCPQWSGLRRQNLSQVLASATARYEALAKYASNLLNSKLEMPSIN